MKASQALKIFGVVGNGGVDAGSAALELQMGQAHFEKLQKDERGFQLLSSLLKTTTGINLPLNDKNSALMAARLAPLLREHGLNGYSELHALLQRDPRLMGVFINCLTTNTTHFFREGAHFEALTKLLPAYLEQKAKARGPRELRVWCAASSTGQEPYTILMTLLEARPDLVDSGMLKFISTDIDVDVLKRAAGGTYTEQETQGIPKALLSKYLKPIKTSSGETRYRFEPKLLNAIRFAQLNLMSDPYPFQHKFDIIFCRNVLIYFEHDTASAVVDRMARSLAPGGYMFLGHSESGTMRNPQLTQISHALYQKRPDSKGGNS